LVSDWSSDVCSSDLLAALVAGDSSTAAALAPTDGRFALRTREAKQGFRTSGRNPLEVTPG